MKNYFFILFILTSCSSSDSNHMSEKKFNTDNIVSKSTAYDAGIIYNEEKIYTVSPPPGWILDNVSGSDIGLKFVVYPQDKTPNNASSTMHTHIFETEEDLNHFIEKDLKGLKGLKKDLIIKKATSIPLRNNKEAVLIDIENGFKGKKYERLAFFRDGNQIISFALFSNNKDEFINSLEPFKKFVKSYLFMTSNVKIN